MSWLHRLRTSSFSSRFFFFTILPIEHSRYFSLCYILCFYILELKIVYPCEVRHSLISVLFNFVATLSWKKTELLLLGSRTEGDPEKLRQNDSELL